MSTIQMTRLGTAGQWGNQVIQYAFVRTYARRHGLDYELPPWAGQVFFGHQDPPITQKLPDWRESWQPYPHEAAFGIPNPPQDGECHDRDFLGWAQYHTSWYAPDREFIQGLFRATPEVEARHSPLVDALRQRGDTIIGLHLRRGDSGRMIYFFTPIIWCLEWLEENLDRFSRPVLFLATEDASLKPWFAKYGVVTADDLGVDFRGESPANYVYPYDVGPHRARQLTFFPDWYLLQHSDVVVAAESTFSVSAAWVNRGLREFWRPRLSLRGFEQCDVWDMHVSPREHLNDYPGIPGTQLDTNPEFEPHWRGYKPKHPSVTETADEINEWLAQHGRPR